MTSSMIVDQGILCIPHTVTFGRVGHHHWSPLNRAFREEQYQFERHKTPSKQQVWKRAGMLVQNYRKYRPSTPPDCKNSNILQDTDLTKTCQSFVSTNQKKNSPVGIQHTSFHSHANMPTFILVYPADTWPQIKTALIEN